MNHPTFAVVGHPNKGKSSIVASLSLDDSVAISNTPGTTHTKRSFPLQVDGVTIYELFDTPGFQRARKVLAWLEQHKVSADKKQDIVKEFVIQYKHDPQFHDEIELLEPILDGAGIIYVIDASKPYSSEYEAEMEILRWCNQPSMALINHIEEDDFTQDWKRALGHYFKLIRTYNPMQATYKEHIAILESISHLNEEWTQNIKVSIQLFERYHKQRLQEISFEITQFILTTLRYTEKLSIKGEEATELEEKKIEQSYKESLRKMEKRSYKKIATLLHHNHIDEKVFELPFEDIDLFSKQSAAIFGLTKRELLITTTTSGAVTGAGIDLLLAGHTGFLGAAIGGAVGGISGYFGFDELFRSKLLGKKLGQKYLQIGPMQNKNFPYILLNRSIFYVRKLLEFSHAKRDKFILDQNEQQENLLEESKRQKLEKFHKLFRSNKDIDNEKLQEYAQIILKIITKEF